MDLVYLEIQVKFPTAYNNLCFLIDLLLGLVIQEEDAGHGRG